MHPVLFRIPVPAWEVPVLGRLGVIPIYSYGVMLGLSLIVGWYLTLWLCEKDGLDRDRMATCYVVTALTALVGSRWMYLLTNLDELRTFGDLFAFRGGGLVAYGGFLGGFIGSLVFARVTGLRLLPWADAAAPSLAVGLAITRVGCYLFGCDYGRPLPPGAPHWLVRLGTFPRWSGDQVSEGVGSPAWLEHVARKLIEPDTTASLAVHPTQLYESLLGIALVFLLFFVRRTRGFQGQVFLIATFSYGLFRFALELIRDDPERGSFPLSLPSHVLWPACLLAFAVAFCMSIGTRFQAGAIRRAIYLAAYFPPVAAAVALRPENFTEAERASLSTSQLIGLASALAAAWLYRAYDPRRLTLEADGSARG